MDDVEVYTYTTSVREVGIVTDGWDRNHWTFQLRGFHDLFHLGIEQPDLKEGDKVKITVAKVKA